MSFPFLRLALALTFAALVTPGFTAPAVEQVEVFVSGRDGYHTYRIPAVIRAKNGDLNMIDDP